MRALALVYAGGRHYSPHRDDCRGLVQPTGARCCRPALVLVGRRLPLASGPAESSVRIILRPFGPRGPCSHGLAPFEQLLPLSELCDVGQITAGVEILGRKELRGVWELARLAVTKALRAVPHLDQRAPFPIQHGHLSQQASPRRSRFPVPQGSPRERRGQQLMSGSRDKGTGSRQRQRGDSSVHGKAERTGECKLMTGNEAEGKLQCVSGAGIAAAPWVGSQAFVPWSPECPDREETETEAQEISVSHMGGC